MADDLSFDDLVPSGGGTGTGGGGLSFDDLVPGGTAKSVLGAQSTAAQGAMAERGGKSLTENLHGFIEDAQKRILKGVAELKGEKPPESISPGVTEGQWSPGRGLAIRPLGAPAPGTPTGPIQQTAEALGNIAGGGIEQFTAVPKAYLGVPAERVTGVPVETQSALAGAAGALAPGVAGALGRRAGATGPLEGDILPPERGNAPTAPRPDPTTIEGEIIRAEPREGLNENVRLLQPTVPHSFESERGNLSAAGGTNPLAEMSPEARQILQEKFDEEGHNTHTIEQRIEEMSPHEYLGEISPNFEKHTSAIQTQGGAATNEIAQSVRRRHAESAERIENELDQAFGRNINRRQWEQALKEQRARDAQPFWQNFNNLQITPTPEIESLLPALQAAGATAQANKWLTMERLPASMGFPEEASVAEQTRIPTARAFQYAKEHLDDQIEAKTRAGERGQVRVLTGLKRALVDAIDNHPDPRIAGVWREAREAWGGPTALITAKNLGETILSNKTHVEQVPELLRGMSAPELQSLIYGLRGHFTDMAGGRGSRVPTTLIDEILSRTNQEKIALILDRAYPNRGAELAQNLFEGLEHERRIRGAQQRLIGGSPTAERRAYQELWHADALNPRISAMMQAGQLAADFFRHPGAAVVKAAKERGLDIVGQRKEAAAQRIRDEVARALTLQGPERDAVLRQLAANSERAAGPVTANPTTAQPRQPMRRPGTTLGRLEGGERQRIGEAERARRKAAEPTISEARNTAILEAGHERATGPQLPENLRPPLRQAMERPKARLSTADEAAATSKDIVRIMDKARFEDAANTIHPSSDRVSSQLSTTDLSNEWLPGYDQAIADLKEFKPGYEGYDEMTPEEREDHRKFLQEEADAYKQDLEKHNRKVRDGLAAYHKKAQAYADRVKRALDEIDARLSSNASEAPKERASGGRVDELPLITRKQSNYAPDRGKPDHHCGPDKQWPHGFCAKFMGPHRCKEVAGFIATKGGCDWYKRSGEDADSVDGEEEQRRKRADGGPTFDQRYRGDKGDRATFAERFGGDTQSRADQVQGDVEDRRDEPFLSAQQMAGISSHERKSTHGKPHPLYAAGGAVNHEPTEAQKQAGNYAKRHVRIHGLDISIENERGSNREGVGKDGKPWKVKMPAAYGDIKRTRGADGDNVDVYLGPHLKSDKVFVVDQKDAETGKFDEHKAFIQFGSAEQVRAYYLRGFSDGKGKHRLGHITEMSIGRFKAWLDRGDTTKPITQAA